MANTETTDNGNKVQISTKVDPAIFSVVAEMATAEDRTISNMVERLLKTNPQVQEILETSTESALSA